MRVLTPDRRNRFWILFLTAAIVSECGCSHQAGSRMGDVTGTVTYAGKPVAKAGVTFVPTAKGAHAAVGVTNAAGKYSLSSSGQIQGAITGLCQVMITLRAPYDGPVPEGMSPAYAQEQFQNEGKPLIPEKYFSTQTSGFSADVKPGRNTFNFTLQD